jgi:hypothetical protein
MLSTVLVFIGLPVSIGWFSGVSESEELGHHEGEQCTLVSVIGRARPVEQLDSIQVCYDEDGLRVTFSASALTLVTLEEYVFG